MGSSILMIFVIQEGIYALQRGHLYPQKIAHEGRDYKLEFSQRMIFNQTRENIYITSVIENAK